jgi:aryl-alcohol dehydrogenase-like predicted oxidoreductase
VQQLQEVLAAAQLGLSPPEITQLDAASAET